jgi:hypothetical protein
VTGWPHTSTRAPRPFRQIQRDALAAGISIPMLRSAKRLTGVRSIQISNSAG